MATVYTTTTVTPAAVKTEEVKLTASMKAQAWHCYTAVAMAIESAYAGTNEGIDHACQHLSTLVEKVHGVQIDGASLFLRLCSDMVKSKTTKADGRFVVRFNGISSFHKWVKTLFAHESIIVESNAGEDPSKKQPVKRPRKQKTPQEKAIALLKGLSADEVKAIFAAMAA